MRQNKKGFTLVEIIVVVVILAVLMAVAVPAVLKYIDTADDAKIYTVARTYMNDLQYATTKELANLQEGETWETFEKNVATRLAIGDFYTQYGFGSGQADINQLPGGGLPRDWSTNGYFVWAVYYTAKNNAGDIIVSYNDSGTLSGNLNSTIDLSNGVTFTEYVLRFTKDFNTKYIVRCVPNGKIEIVSKTE